MDVQQHRVRAVPVLGGVGQHDPAVDGVPVGAGGHALVQRAHPPGGPHRGAEVGEQPHVATLEHAEVAGALGRGDDDSDRRPVRGRGRAAHQPLPVDEHLGRRARCGVDGDPLEPHRAAVADAQQHLVADDDQPRARLTQVGVEVGEAHALDRTGEVGGQVEPEQPGRRPDERQTVLAEVAGHGHEAVVVDPLDLVDREVAERHRVHLAALGRHTVDPGPQVEVVALVPVGDERQPAAVRAPGGRHVVLVAVGGLVRGQGQLRQVGGRVGRGVQHSRHVEHEQVLAPVAGVAEAVDLVGVGGHQPRRLGVRADLLVGAVPALLRHPRAVGEPGAVGAPPGRTAAGLVVGEHDRLAAVEREHRHLRRALLRRAQERDVPSVGRDGRGRVRRPGGEPPRGGAVGGHRPQRGRVAVGRGARSRHGGDGQPPVRGEGRRGRGTEQVDVFRAHPRNLRGA